MGSDGPDRPPKPWLRVIWHIPCASSFGFRVLGSWGGMTMTAGGLEAIFVEIGQEHAHKAAAIRQQSDTARKEALAAAQRVSNRLEEGLNSGVQQVFLNEKRIESETRAVASTVQHFAKQTEQWLTLFHGLDSAVKEIGDFENWIKIVEHNCEAVASALSRIKPSHR